MDVFFTLLPPAICRAHLSSSFVFFLCAVISYLELLCICLRSIPLELASSTPAASSSPLPCPLAEPVPAGRATSRRWPLRVPGASRPRHNPPPPLATRSHRWPLQAPLLPPPRARWHHPQRMLLTPRGLASRPWPRPLLLAPRGLACSPPALPPAPRPARPRRLGARPLLLASSPRAASPSAVSSETDARRRRSRGVPPNQNQGPCAKY